MLDNTFTYNGHSSDEFGIKIERRPDLSRSARKFKSATVPGRNGNIYQLENAWEEVTVAYDIFAGGSQDGDAIPSFTDIVEWLNSADDYCVLSDTYDPTHYRLGIFVDAIDIESAWHQHGKATVKFRCRPQRFIVEAPVSVTSGDTITNPTNHIAHPIITLTGSGAGSLLDMNRTMNTSISHLVNPYPSLSLLLSKVGTTQVFWGAEREQPDAQGRNLRIQYIGESSTGGTLTSINNTTGTLTFTPNNDYGIGMIYPCSPSSQYTLSMSVSMANCKVGIFLADMSSPNYIRSYILKSLSSGANQLSFTTLPAAGYLAIVFYGVQGSSVTFSSIMLNDGTTAKTFSPYSAPYANTLTIGSRTLQFMSAGFDTAEIDCERENFTLNGNDANNVVSITENGGQSVEYLQLDKGNNTVTYSNAITSMTMESRLWEL